MAVGDKTAQSYGWPAKLNESVPDGGSVTISAPGFDHRYTDVKHIDVTVEGKEIWRNGDGKVDVAVNSTSHDEPVTLTVTNRSGEPWPSGRGLYVFAPHLLAAGANEWDLKEQIWDLQQRVKALEGVEPMTVSAADLAFIQKHNFAVVMSLKPRLARADWAYTANAPVCTVAPAVTGTATVGQTLTATNGTWLNSPAFTKQWRRNGFPLSGATAATYVLVAADFKTAVDCLVTATNGAGVVTQAGNSTLIG